MMKEKVSIAFSGGKESVLLVHKLLEENYIIDSLFVTVTEGKTTSHQIDEHFIKLQAASLGFPLKIIRLPHFTQDHYENSLRLLMDTLKDRGVHKICYGDIYLEDVRSYKEKFFKNLGSFCCSI